MRALVADDDTTTLDMISTVLSLAGFEVLTAANGSEALDHARAHRPDIVLLDVMMPGMDGLAVLREMRADLDLVSIPVLLVTARSSDDAVWDGWRHGTDSYVTKPFNPRQLVEEVWRVIAARALDSHELQDEVTERR